MVRFLNNLDFEEKEAKFICCTDLPQETAKWVKSDLKVCTIIKTSMKNNKNIIYKYKKCDFRSSSRELDSMEDFIVIEMLKVALSP